MDSLLASTSPVALLIPCANLDEAKVALDAIEAFRAGNAVPPSAAGPTCDADAAQAERIEAALHGAPLNRPKEIVLRLLLDAAPQAWVAYPDMQAAFTAERLDPERAAAALRDLSWQMGEFLPPQDTAGLGRKIEVMAERSRAGGIYRYRLTKAGRMAVASFFKQSVPDAPETGGHHVGE